MTHEAYQALLIVQFINDCRVLFMEVRAERPCNCCGSDFPEATTMSHLSPQLRTEDLPQAAIIVANMLDTFLDAQKRLRSDVDKEVEHPPVISLKREAQGGSHAYLEEYAEHLSRKAYVYVRQSTLGQVLHHQESTDRQYALKEKALALNWNVRPHG